MRKEIKISEKDRKLNCLNWHLEYAIQRKEFWSKKHDHVLEMYHEGQIDLIKWMF